MTLCAILTYKIKKMHRVDHHNQKSAHVEEIGQRVFYVLILSTTTVQNALVLKLRGPAIITVGARVAKIHMDKDQISSHQRLFTREKGIGTSHKNTLSEARRQPSLWREFLKQ